MGGDLTSIFVLALFAMFTPTLLAAVTVMMLLPSPKRLMLGYLLGALTTSITLGLVIVFSLHGSASVDTAQHTLGPGAEIVLGLLALLVAFVLGTGRGGPLQRRRERRREEKEAKESTGATKQSWPDRMLGKGSARISFAVGVALTLPGASYLAALDRMAKLDASVPETVLLVVVFCLIQQLLLEVPLLGYAFAPEKTQDRVTRFRAWLTANARRVGAILAATIGTLLILRGVIALLA